MNTMHEGARREVLSGRFTADEKRQVKTIYDGKQSDFVRLAVLEKLEREQKLLGVKL